MKFIKFQFVLAVLAVPVLLTPDKVISAEVPAQVAAIDDAIEQVWNDFGIRPAPEVDDRTWCRRVFLDVIGRIPNGQELMEFEADRDNDKRAKLVDKLLHDDKYTAEYAGHWANDLDQFADWPQRWK